jgi:hypothetical protein
MLFCCLRLCVYVFVGRQAKPVSPRHNNHDEDKNDNDVLQGTVGLLTVTFHFLLPPLVDVVGVEVVGGGVVVDLILLSVRNERSDPLHSLRSVGYETNLSGLGMLDSRYGGGVVYSRNSC